MGSRFVIICAVIGIIGVMMGSTGSAAVASDIIDEWATVKAPVAPELKPVTVDPKTTALLMLDFMNQSFGKRPRCLASLPAMKKLLGEARAAKVAVVYSITANTTTADVVADLAPTAEDPWVQSGVDKYFKSNLEKILKDKGIQTVIVVGTASEGAVLYTGSASAIRGLNVIVPADGMCSVEAFAEQYVVWHMTHAPLISSKVTLTKSGMIKF
jgi:nicotinamidase-related amidase